MNDLEILATGGKQSKLTVDYSKLPLIGLDGVIDNPKTRVEYAIYSLLMASDESMVGHAGFDSRLVFGHLYRAFHDVIQFGDGFHRDMSRNNPYIKVMGLPIWAWEALAETRKHGCDRYEENNWKLIDYRSHINHAVNHLLKAIAGDTSEDHISHALCRIMMAIGVEVEMYKEYTNKNEAP